MIDVKFRRKGTLGTLKIIREAFEIQMRRMRNRGMGRNPRALQRTQETTTAEPPSEGTGRDRESQAGDGKVWSWVIKVL